MTVTVARPSDVGVERTVFESGFKLGGEMTWLDDESIGDEERFVVLLATKMDGVRMDEGGTWVAWELLALRETLSL